MSKFGKIVLATAVCAAVVGAIAVVAKYCDVADDDFDDDDFEEDPDDDYELDSDIYEDQDEE